MQKGGIVLISFPFTDLSGTKNRPSLVLVAGKDDVTLSFISTQLHWQEETDIIVHPGEKNGLEKAVFDKNG